MASSDCMDGAVQTGSEDKRNPAPSEAELKMTDFLFNCAFDIGRLVIVDKLAEAIGGIEDIKESNGRSGLSSKLNQLVRKVDDGEFDCGLKPLLEESNKATANLGEKFIYQTISPYQGLKLLSRGGLILPVYQIVKLKIKAEVKSSETVLPKNTLLNFFSIEEKEDHRVEVVHWPLYGKGFRWEEI